MRGGGATQAFANQTHSFETNSSLSGIWPESTDALVCVCVYVCVSPGAIHEVFYDQGGAHCAYLATNTPH